MHGCIGSTDGCHVGMLNCPFQLMQFNMGCKLNMQTRTHNLTCNHRRRILHTTSCHPGRWCDKTLVRFDEFVMNVKHGMILPDHTFTLLSRGEDGSIVKKQFSGVWLMADNGHLGWSVTIPPFTSCKTHAQRRWSKWVESMRKDVECTFGILKGRFWQLKNGTRVRGAKAMDNMWMTCCALHNFFLEEDNLDCP